MDTRITSSTTVADSGFNMAFGWLAAVAVSIASWAVL
jgi:hypothetical protein